MSGKGYLSGMGFSLDEVLKKAALPEDLFARQTPSLTAEEYFRFMEAIDALSPDEQTPVHLAAAHFRGVLQPQRPYVPEAAGAI